ncbi:hypothetical protein HK101_001087 [Irineochytrium annulatum]|nr:hypothetical protein HK101_001087 [Irineochytrium annulatum]
MAGDREMLLEMVMTRRFPSDDLVLTDSEGIQPEASYPCIGVSCQPHDITNETISKGNEECRAATGDGLVSCRGGACRIRRIDSVRLVAHADDPEESFDQDTKMEEADDGEITADQATAQSLVCDDCGRMLRDAAAAEGHAIKTQHTNFSESTQVIKPLTEEEKKKKLEELKARMALKREEKRLLEKEEEKSKEKVRRKTGQEMVAIKEQMKEAEMKKAMDEKLREKEEDRIAKAKIKAQIEQDKRDRAAKVGARQPFCLTAQQIEREKQLRQGLPTDEASGSAKPAVAVPATISKDYAEARIHFRLPDRVITQSFKSDDTLQSLIDFLSKQEDVQPGFKMVFLRKPLTGSDKSLKDLGLVPSAAIIVQ